MEKDNIVKNKSYEFALRIIKLYKHLTEKKMEYVLSKQILRCGTSIGANIEESIGGVTKKEFVSKLFIAYREARETHYWIRLLKDSGYITNKEADSLIEDNEELQKILGKIISTSRKGINN